jgi:hypothetical protein
MIGNGSAWSGREIEIWLRCLPTVMPTRHAKLRIVKRQCLNRFSAIFYFSNLNRGCYTNLGNGHPAAGILPCDRSAATFFSLFESIITVLTEVQFFGGL